MLLSTYSAQDIVLGSDITVFEFREFLLQDVKRWVNIALKEKNMKY